MKNEQLVGGTLGAAPRLVAVSNEELTLVAGGSVISKIKGAAKWAVKHLFVDVGHGIVAGVKGTF
jgi:hypothetical protein